MKNIKVTLQHHTPLYIASDGARTCWSSQDKSDTCKHQAVTYTNRLDNSMRTECSICETEQLNTITIGPKDLALIDRVGNQFHHASILEHITFNFFIDGISRACLQEISRHRIASLSVKSTRYTLKELKFEQPFIEINSAIENYIDKERALKYLVRVDESLVDAASIEALDKLRSILTKGISNDIAKYCLPESYRTQLTWTINMRSLQNFLSLRTDRTALPEIQLLAHLLYEALPADAQSLVAHCVKGIDDATV